MTHKEYTRKLGSLPKHERLEFMTAFGYITDELDALEKEHNESRCSCLKDHSIEPCENLMGIVDAGRALNQIEDMVLERLSRRPVTRLEALAN